MILPLPKEYLDTFKREVIDTKGKLNRVNSSINEVHSFLFSDKVKENREWAAYLAIKGRIEWTYSTSLNDIKDYAIISKRYYYNNPIAKLINE